MEIVIDTLSNFRYEISWHFYDHKINNYLKTVFVTGSKIQMAVLSRCSIKIQYALKFK